MARPPKEQTRTFVQEEKAIEPKDVVPWEAPKQGFCRRLHLVELDCIWIDGVLLSPIQKVEFDKRESRIKEFGNSSPLSQEIAVKEWRQAYVIRGNHWEKP